MKAEDIAKLPTPETDEFGQKLLPKCLGVDRLMPNQYNAMMAGNRKWNLLSRSLEQRLAAAVMALDEARSLMNEGLDDAIQTYRPFMDKLRAWRETLAAIRSIK